VYCLFALVCLVASSWRAHNQDGSPGTVRPTFRLIG
jgi:hypothetical protein